MIMLLPTKGGREAREILLESVCVQHRRPPPRFRHQFKGRVLLLLLATLLSLDSSSSSPSFFLRPENRILLHFLLSNIKKMMALRRRRSLVLALPTDSGRLRSQTKERHMHYNRNRRWVHINFKKGNPFPCFLRATPSLRVAFRWIIFSLSPTHQNT